MLQRWNGPGGYREVLAVGLPLVFSMISHTVMQFTDRIFLGNYSMEAIAASLPAGITAFLFLSNGVWGFPELGIVGAGIATVAGSAVTAALLALFRTRDLPPEAFRAVVEQGRVLLRFVACYSLIDALALMCLGGLKGAGDTRFVMWALGICSLTVLVLPSYLLVEHLGVGLYGPWACLTLYVVVLTAVSALRFRGGKWRGMSVIGLEVAPASG